MGSIIGAISEETPAFALVSRSATYEIRQYAPVMCASYTYETPLDDPMGNGGDGFRPIANYIFGGNTARTGSGSESIAMTAPVSISKPQSTQIAMTAPVSITAANDTSSREMTFFLPSKYKEVEDLPVPNDPKVRVWKKPAYYAAVTRFSGNAHWQVASQEKQLRDACLKDGVRLSEDPKALQVFQYNPPWTLPFMRTNEIAINLEDQSDRPQEKHMPVNS